MVRGLAAGLGLLASGCASSPGAEPAPRTAAAPPGAARPGRPRHPSVLFVSIDDLNDWTGGLGGHPQVRTPHLDGLAARGRSFTRAFCSASLCNPSRSSLLTGLAPTTLGLFDNTTNFRSLRPAAQTLPQCFAAAGYRTVGIGKIFHNSFPDSISWQEEYPFASFRDRRLKQRPLTPLTIRPEAADTDLERRFDFGPVPFADEELADGKVLAQALSVLASAGPEPLFLGVGFARTHIPWYVPERYFELYPLESVALPELRPDDLDDVGPLARDWVERQRISDDLDRPEIARRAVRAYLAAVSFVDALVGRLLEAWWASPHGREGLVVLWSDHGFHHGQKRHWRKETPWREGTRVPLLLAAPWLPSPGVPCNQPVSLLDLYPTLAELAGLEAPRDLDGRSLLAQLEEPSAPRERPAVMSWRPGSAAVVAEYHRLIRYQDGFVELYDHREDPREWVNVAGRPENRARVAELSRFLPG
ncbi:MAG: sulfatase [Thermoanaerobaculia bacterium]